MFDQPLVYLLLLAGHSLPVREVRGHEAMSELFRFDVRLTLPEGVELDVNALVKTAAALVLERSAVERRIDGIVTELFVSSRLGGRPELSLRLEPRFSLARHRTNLKIFRDKRPPDIVAEVLAELGIAFELRLGESYPLRPYTVQFRESDYHFVSRMLEEEGIFYYFGDGGVMIIGDGSSAYSAIGPAKFGQPAGLSGNDESVWSLGERAQTSVGAIALRDWNLKTPSVPMDVSASGPTAAGPEYYDFPGEYQEPAEGQRIVELMADAYRCAASGIAGRSSVAAFAAGGTFTVADAPAGVPRGSFLITRIDHDFHRERGGFVLRFDGIDEALHYRPARVHDEPILPNPLTGRVTGPPGEDIHTDELGRVKVHFHWDRLQPEDDSCSAWVPVLQDNTGHSVAVPRVGWEVLVHFMEGDPDRPLVLGRVYNAEDPFPVALPANKTQTALKSLSSPTRDGTNQILLEDRASRQLVALHAERDQHVVVALDKAERIGNNERALVGRDEAVTVAADDHIGVGGNRALGVAANQVVTIHGDASREVGGNESLAVMGNHTLKVGSKHHRRVHDQDSVAAKELHERVGVAILETSVRSNSLTGSYGLATTVGGVVVEAARKDKTETAKIARAETIGGLLLTKAKDAITIDVGKKRVTTVGGALKVNAAKSLTIEAGQAVSIKSMVQEHKADNISLEVGGSRVVITPDQISITAAKTIRFVVTGNSQLMADASKQN